MRLAHAARDACRRAQQLFFVGLSLDPQEAVQVLTLAYLKGCACVFCFLYVFLTDSGVVLKFPEYVTRPNFKLFESRQQFLAWEEATSLADRFQIEFFF